MIHLSFADAGEIAYEGVRDPADGRDVWNRWLRLAGAAYGVPVRLIEPTDEDKQRVARSHKAQGRILGAPV